ncbi:hypothetical protein DYD21_07840 [Rhodohalobacter sp. SW132]|uniref:hypothetical protein n=1 Tax=Rhodohalobacter sp. SW132 TaxID=2293433 RepID=UPI000E24823A|nr:hypothetical protein [Rhodohalobacter sp. SW132]REL37687.1 hypothetical protein DYD21_07840 [Rhodohalobacter sp. SW132]
MIKELPKKAKIYLINNKLPLYGGILTAVFTGVAAFLLGNLSGYEAMQMIEIAIPRISMLLNTIILASATILALILTLLGISTGSESKLKKTHYHQVLSLAKFVTFNFVVALIFFQLFNIPITESDAVPTAWYSIVYWFALISSSMLSGLMVAVILMLFSTVQNIICIVGLGQDHKLIYTEEEEEGDDDEDSSRSSES